MAQSSQGSGIVASILTTLLPQSLSNVNESLNQVSSSIASLLPAAQQQTEALLTNTQAIQSAGAQRSGGITDTIDKVASTFGGGLLAASPILSGLLSLFGGGSASTPAPLAAFTLPPSLNFETANVPGGWQQSAVDFGQSGAPRLLSATSPGGTGASSGPQVTVNVQAMDSQSFLDHSHDIANAVQQALLNMHPLNDVISDL